MSALKDQVILQTLNHVRVIYLDRITTKWWNSKRDNGDTAIFTGFYWVRGKEEAGPFKTRSAAIRDAYYRFVLHRELPMINRPTLRRNVKASMQDHEVAA